MMKKTNPPIEVIELTNAVYQSSLGKYFLGQTDIMTFGGDYNAWGGLINPQGSDVDMFLNAYTISNFSDQPLTAEGWLNSTFSEAAKTSLHVAAGNQSLSPAPLPKVKIQSSSTLLMSPIDGVYTFVRRIEPNLTLTKHDFQGMYIIPPGSSFVLFFKSPQKIQAQVRIALGWWEEKRIKSDPSV